MAICLVLQVAIVPELNYKKILRSELNKLEALNVVRRSTTAALLFIDFAQKGQLM